MNAAQRDEHRVDIHHRANPVYTPPDLTEKQLATQVAELANLLGWKRYHTWRSKHSPAGYPDETLVRDRVIFLELKTKTGRVAPAQKDWLRALHHAGAEAYLIRPQHLDDLATVLGAHRGPGDQTMSTQTATEARRRLLDTLEKETT